MFVVGLHTSTDIAITTDNVYIVENGIQYIIYSRGGQWYTVHYI